MQLKKVRFRQFSAKINSKINSEVNFFNAYLSDPKRPSEMVQPVQFRAPNQSFNPKPPPRVPHVSKNKPNQHPNNQMKRNEGPSVS